MNWAKTRQAEAEQLAMDSARLMACTTDRLDKLQNQGFFKRCWSRLSGQAGAMERANVNDMIQMQKIAFRYVNMLQEQQLLMAHSLLSLKNNLNSLAIREEQTRQMIGLLAERTRERFEKLENRVDQLEISTNLQGWLLGLEEREYDVKYPTEYMRLFRVINDFYRIKNDNWNYNDLMFMRKAIRIVGLDPKWKLPIGVFLNSLTDEVQRLDNGIDTYRLAISEHAPATVKNYSQFAIENVSSPVFLTLHSVNTYYDDNVKAIETLQDSLSISKIEALKILLSQSIRDLNINMDYEFPLAETAIEILGCLRLANKLSTGTGNESRAEENACSEANDQSESNASECITSKQDENQKPENNISSDTKQIDIRKINNIRWQPAEIFEDGHGLEIRDLTTFNGSVFFLAKNRWDWDFYFSPDFKKLYKANSKNITGDGSDLDYSSKLKVTNNILFCLNGYRGISASDNGKKWRKLDLPTKCSGLDLTYENVLFNGKLWIIAASYRPTYTYTKSGIIFDSTENTSFTAFQLLIGSTLSDLKPFTFSDDYYKYNVLNVINSGEHFYAHLQHDRNYETLLLKSVDGYKWDKIPWEKGERVYGLSPCKDGIIISASGSKIYTYSPELQGIMILNLPSDISSQWNERCFRYFPSHKLYALITNNEKYLYLSNNLFDWKQVWGVNIFNIIYLTGSAIREDNLVVSTYTSGANASYNLYYGELAQS